MMTPPESRYLISVLRSWGLSIRRSSAVKGLIEISQSVQTLSEVSVRSRIAGVLVGPPVRYPAVSMV